MIGVYNEIFKWTERSNLCQRLWIFIPLQENMGKRLSSKYGQKFLDTTKKSATDALKTAVKKGDLKSNRSNRWFSWKIILLTKLQKVLARIKSKLRHPRK